MERPITAEGSVGERSGVFIPRGVLPEHVYLQFEVQLDKDEGSIYQRLVSDMVKDAAALGMPMKRPTDTSEE